MSPTTEKTRNPSVDETRHPETVNQPVSTAPTTVNEQTSTPDDMDQVMVQQTPGEALEDEENNPWRNHEDDQHKWLGLLLAAVGFGAIGYLVGGV